VIVEDTSVLALVIFFRFHHVHHLRDMASLRPAVLRYCQPRSSEDHKHVSDHQPVSQRDRSMSLLPEGNQLKNICRVF
jgi:hypothetical protein